MDYAYSRLSGVLPQMLGQLETDTIALNAYTDAKKAPKTPSDRAAVPRNAGQHRHTLKADLGVLLWDDGERLIVVDETGTRS